MKMSGICFRFLMCLFFIAWLPTEGICQTPFPKAGPIYKDDVVSRIDIIIPGDSLEEIFARGNEESDHHFLSTFYFDNGEIRDTLENVGFRLRGNTSRYSSKKSFKVSFNTYKQGRKWHGVEKLNLNGEHNDPTLSRAKICWDLLREFEVPASRANHINLYINGEYYGVYANVEHIDENFVQSRFGNKGGNLYKCLWPADLIYLGEDPDLYKGNNGSRRAYELITNKESDDYSDLARFIDVLNNTSLEERPCELEAIFNVNTFLRAMAFDILTGNWDGPLYNKNNFYLYYNEATGLFEYIPYDLDNTFGIDWFQINWAQRDLYSWAPSNEQRPLYHSIMEVDEYRDRFSYYVNKFINEAFSEQVMFPGIEVTKSMIRPFVIDDPFYPLDYGYSLEDFDNSFDDPISSQHTPIGLKTFIAQRINASFGQLKLNYIAPIISRVSDSYSGASQDITVLCYVEDDQDNVKVEVCYQWNDSGSIECIEMYDDGSHGDSQSKDNVFTTQIDAIFNSGMLSYYIEGMDNQGRISRQPRCGMNKIIFEQSSVTLAINEIMASNSQTITDEYGEFDDWIEITNYGEEPVFLGGRYLSDKPDQPTKWAMPEIWIQPNEFLLFWADEDGNQGDNHTNFKLRAGGEFIGIFDVDEITNQLIDGLEFGQLSPDEAYGRKPNGVGNFEILDPTPGASNTSTTSAEEINKFSIVKIYPNPFEQLLNIDIKNNTKNLKLTIFNVQGKAILDQKIFDAQKLNTSNWAKGLYLAVIKNDGQLLSSYKIIKTQ